LVTKPPEAARAAKSVYVCCGRWLSPAAVFSWRSRVSHEWTVPLCTIHHRSLHDFGAGEACGRSGASTHSDPEKLGKERHCGPASEAADMELSPALADGTIG